MGGGGHKHRTKHGHRVAQPDQWHEPAKPKPDASFDWYEALSIVDAVQEIVHHKPNYVTMAVRYGGPLALLNEGVNGKEEAAECIKLIDAGLAALAPGLAPLEEDPGGKRYLEEMVREPLTRIREAKQHALQTEQTDLARKRVRREDPGAERPHERATVLRDVLTVIKQDFEAVVRLKEGDIEKTAEELYEGVDAAKRAQLKRWGVNTLVDIQAPLMLVSGALTLTDDQFIAELKDLHDKGLPKQIATYTELVEAAVELTGGLTITMATITGHIVRVIGGTELVAAADTMLGFSRLATLKLSQVVTVLELVHGFFVMIDSHASREERVDGLLDVGMSAAWLLESPGLGAFIAGAKTVIALVRLAGGSMTGLQNAGMQKAFEEIEGNGDALLQDGEYAARAETLMGTETDAAKKTALAAVREEWLQRLKIDVQRIADAATTDNSKQPGGFPVLAEVFAPVVAVAQTMTTPAEIEAAVKVAVDRTVYALQHRRDLAVAALSNASLAEMEQEIADNEAEKKQEEDDRARHDANTAVQQAEMRKNGYWDRHH